MSKKMKVGVVFGGKSGEHEVSLVSASAVVKALTGEKFEVIEVGIDKKGQWYVGKDCLQKFKEGDYKDLKKMNFGLNGLVDSKGHLLEVEAFFPVLHGPFGEDGTVQGLFEMMDVPYVGCGVLASSTAMDKLQCKAIWEAVGLPVVPYFGFNRISWTSEQPKILAQIEEKFAYPLFVKPANMGSSVGISKAKHHEELVEAINLAAKYDRRILVEPGLDVREIECAVLGNDEPVACEVGEIIVGGEFYDFNDKYVDGKSTTEVPARLNEAMSDEIKEICIKAYKALDCSGLARVDCFMVKGSKGEIYLNEINTMPGFTKISMYPKMVAAYGLSYEKLVEKLINLALERYRDRQKNEVVFNSGSDWFKE